MRDFLYSGKCGMKLRLFVTMSYGFVLSLEQLVYTAAGCFVAVRIMYFSTVLVADVSSIGRRDRANQSYPSRAPTEHTPANWVPTIQAGLSGCHTYIVDTA